MSTSSTRRRLAGVASLSAVIAAMVAASVPAATLAASGFTSGDVVVRGETLRAKIVNPDKPVTGNVNADGYDIAVYFGPGRSGKVDANVHGALWYGVVADQANVTVTGSQIHDIGDTPLNGVQRGNAVFYYNGARGTISGNEVYDFQKNGITISGKAANNVDRSAIKTSATVAGNVITGEGPVGYIAQNGIQVSFGASALVKGNTVRGFDYTGADEATGLLAYQADAVRVSGNRFADDEVGIYSFESGKVAVSGNSFARNGMNVYGPVKAIHDVRGSYATTSRSNRIRIHLTSEAQPKDTVIGKRLHWVVKVDGRKVMELRQRFSDHDDFVPYFASGNHRVEIVKNDRLVKTLVIKA